MILFRGFVYTGRRGCKVRRIFGRATGTKYSLARFACNSRWAPILSGGLLEELTLQCLPLLPL